MCNDRQQHTIVLGGAGFIGSHLCRMLLKEGHHVLCIDNLSTGSLSNISNLFANPSFRFLRHDITQPFPAEVSMVVTRNALKTTFVDAHIIRQNIRQVAITH